MSVENEEMSKEMLDQYNAAFADANGGVAQDEQVEVETAVASTEGQEQTAAEHVEVAAEARETAQAEAKTEAEVEKTPGDADKPEAQESTAEAEPTEEQKADAALEIQRLKSWEGRLKKQAAEQKAREEASDAAAAARLASTTEKAESPAQEQAEQVEQVAGSVADQVADGTLTVAQAMQQVSADFGEDFVKMIQVLVTAQAAEASGKVIAEVKGKVDGLAQTFASEAEAKHFERIETAHPDFNQIRVSPEFAAFVEAADPDLQRIANKGSAKEVIQLVKTYKDAQKAAAKKPAAPVAEPEGVDAAAGVRSGSLQLPAETASNDDYAGAFAEAAATAAKRN